jgi:hypothetical protein
MGAPKRTTRIPARGSTLAAADTLLSAAADERLAYHFHTQALRDTPRWRLRRRRKLQAARVRALLRYMQAITAAQDVARKGKDIPVG